MSRIIVTPNYYQGTCSAPSMHYATWGEIEAAAQDIYEDQHPDDMQDAVVAEFDSEAAAGEVACMISSDESPYYLAHGEANRPDYEVEEDGFEGPDCLPADLFSRDFGELIQQEDIPAEALKKLENSNVEFYSDEGDCQIFAESVDLEGQRYTIVFCPKTLAIANLDGDTGNINWSGHAFFVEDC